MHPVEKGLGPVGNKLKNPNSIGYSLRSKTAEDQIQAVSQVAQPTEAVVTKDPSEEITAAKTKVIKLRRRQTIGKGISLAAFTSTLGGIGSMVVSDRTRYEDSAEGVRTANIQTKMLRANDPPRIIGGQAETADSNYNIWDQARLTATIVATLTSIIRFYSWDMFKASPLDIAELELKRLQSSNSDSTKT